MKSFIFGVVLGLLLVPFGGYLYIKSGSMPVATSDSPLPLEKFMAKTALRARIGKEYPRSVPIQPTEDNMVAGARIYREDCAFCHGLPQQPEPDAAKGMFPHPPQLFDPNHMVTDDPPGVTFWKAKNGIRLTGMPGFHARLSDNQMWQVSLLLANADKAPPAAMQELAMPSAAVTPAHAQ